MRLSTTAQRACYGIFSFGVLQITANLQLHYNQQPKAAGSGQVCARWTLVLSWGWKGQQGAADLSDQARDTVAQNT